MSNTFLDSLPTLDVDIEPFYAENEGARDLTVGLDEDIKHVATPHRRQFKNMLRVSNAAHHLAGIPADGEAWHVVMRGNYDSWDLVPAILDLASPATIAELNVCTLGFNQDGTQSLTTLIDDGKIAKVTFICSHYFKGVDGPLYDDLHTALTSRGHRCLAMRCHAKILLLELTDARCLTIESSANLRSCRGLEQFTLTHDRDLLFFHRRWQCELLDKAGA